MVLLYEMIAGQMPFSVPGGYLKIMMAIVQTEPPSLVAEGRMGRTLWAVVHRCLAKDPARRYADARALLDALDDVMVAI